MMHTNRRLLVRLVLALLVAAVLPQAGCSDESSPSGPSTEWDENKIQFDVDWAPNTVRFAAEDMSSLVGIDTANQTFTFRTGSPKVAELETGKVIVVNDYTIRRVTRTYSSGGNTVVETEFAALTDAMTNADISWDYGVDFAPGAFVQSLRRKGVQVQHVTTDSIKFAIKIGTYTYKVDMRLDNDKANLSLVAEKEHLDTKVAECSLVGELRRFRSKGTVVIRDGVLQQFSTNNKDVEGNFNVKIVAAGSGSDLNLEVPITLLKYPIPQLPFFEFSIKTVVIINSLIPPDGSTLIEANFKYNVDQGIEFDKKNFVLLPILNVKKREFDKTQKPHTGASSPVAANFGLALPRFEIGLLNTTLAWIQSAYLIGGDYTPFPACQQARARFIGAGGVALGALGVSVFEKSKTLWNEEKVLLKAGNCP